MKSLKERNAAGACAHHANGPVRVYESDGVQELRIRNTRAVLKEAISSFPISDWPLRIVELGCGTADISGPCHIMHRIMGYDCNQAAIDEAQRRFPNGLFLKVDILTMEPIHSDILILCELLEHMPYPELFVATWLPYAKSSIISHPINGDLEGDMSGGDHQWSFTEADFDRWPVLGNHVPVDSTLFQMSSYTIGLQRTILLAP